MANDYISRRVELAEIDRFIHTHVDDSLELDKSGRPDALLFGFIQVRIYQMDDGLPEDAVRNEIAEYLDAYGLRRGETPKRAAG